MTDPTFKLYHKPPLPQSAQDKRGAQRAEYIGHVIVDHKCPKCGHVDSPATYGLLAHTVTEGKGKDQKRHFEGDVIDWQQLIREHVARAEPTPNTGQSDWVKESDDKPFDDSLEGIGS